MFAARDVFIVQPTCPPTDRHLMELLIMIDTFVRASAERVTAVIPYFGYARSDKKDRPRVPITAKLVANLITTAGAERVLTIDLHASQIQGFFDIPVDHLYAAPIVVEYFKANPIENLIVVAPDTGGAERARAYAKRLNAGLALCDKRRERANEADVMNIVGDVRGKNCLIIDDMCDTGGTICKVAEALHKAGANEVIACFTHGVLSGQAVENITGSYLEKGDRDQHDPDPRKRNAAGRGRQDRGFERRGAAGIGDQVDSRRDERVVAIYIVQQAV